jgi:hypothetical protein
VLYFFLSALTSFTCNNQRSAVAENLFLLLFLYLKPTNK